MNVQNKIFVVTGSGGGIGGEVALELINNGAKVAAVDVNKANLDNLEKKVLDKNAISTHIVDITNQDSVSAMYKEVVAVHGAIDGVINCAGIIQPFVKINELDYDAINRVMNVNFYGTVNMVKSALPYLLKRPEGYIVNVSSMGGFLPVPGQSVYGASKAAVKLFTEGLYAELLDTSIRVSVVFPGATNTNITQNSKVDAPSLGSDAKSAGVEMLSANEVARTIIKGIEKNKPQIFTGQDSRFMNRLYRLHPVYATKLIAKKMSSLL